MSWKCSECGSEMRVYKQDTSTGNGGKVYDRTMYICNRCDIWDTHEVPQPEEIAEQ
ncbi:MAG: hypothetical protein JWO50_91 [Candidatus Kaiserbacteria bacterium]|nr:hypothetical protein [Candidatus Kaiserbacteria bacterium]